MLGRTLSFAGTPEFFHTNPVPAAWDGVWVLLGRPVPSGWDGWWSWSMMVVMFLVVIFSSFIFETRKIGFSQFRIFENDSNHTDFQWFYLKTNWLYLGFLRFSWKILKTKIWKTTRVSPCFSIIFCCIFVIFQSPNCILYFLVYSLWLFFKK